MKKEERLKIDMIVEAGIISDLKVDPKLDSWTGLTHVKLVYSFKDRKNVLDQWKGEIYIFADYHYSWNFGNQNVPYFILSVLKDIFTEEEIRSIIQK